MVRVSATLVLMLGMAVGAGCSSDPGRTRAKSTISSLQDVRQQLQSGITEVDAVQSTLNSLQNNSRDQRTLYAQLKDQTQQVEERAVAVAGEVQSMQTRAQEYRSAWQQEAAQITDPDLRQAAQDRADTTQQRFASIIEEHRATKEAYYPFIRKLRDIQTFLSNDLTAAGVNAAKPTMQDAVQLGDTLKQQARKVIQEIDQALPRLSPATAPARRATTAPSGS